MEKKSIWLVLFALVAVAGGYLWWSGGSTPKTEETTEPVADSSLSDPDAPALGTGKEQIRPTVPGARQEAGTLTPDPVSPSARTAPAPGFTPPPSYESFNAPNPTSDAPAPGRVEPPPSAFEPVPPQAFENPDFVTPPPPPPQFDSEPPPFEADQAPPPQNYDPPVQDGGGEFIPPAEPEGY